jgi:hypothetical protein
MWRALVPRAPSTVRPRARRLKAVALRLRVPPHLRGLGLGARGLLLPSHKVQQTTHDEAIRRPGAVQSQKKHVPTSDSPLIFVAFSGY